MPRWFLIFIIASLGLGNVVWGQDSSGVERIGTYSIDNSYRALAVQEDVAYAADYVNVFATLDISNLPEVEPLDGVYGFNNAYDIVVQNGYAYSGGEVLSIIDVSDPAQIQELARFEASRCIYAIANFDNYLALADYNLLRIIDVSDPARPENVSSLNLAGSRGVALFANLALIPGEDLYIVNVSNPRQPRLEAQVNLPFYGMQIVLDRMQAYVAETQTIRQGDETIYRSYLRIFDLAQPQRPQELGVFGPVDGRIWNLVIVEDHAILAADNYLRVVDVSDPAQPVQTGFYQTRYTIRDVARAGDFILAATYNGIDIYDCSNALGQPDIFIAEEDLAHDYGGVVVGLTGNWSFAVLNNGHLQLNITALEVDNPVFTLRCEASRWGYQGGIPAGQIVRDQRLVGVEFIDDLYYLTGGNNGEMSNFVYVLDREGEVVNRFEQFAESVHGMRDLAWDGELLWGADGATVYGFTREGELVRQFQAPLNPVRNLTWDPVNEVIWASDAASDIFGLNREGDVLTQLPRPEIRTYGMAWHPEDPDDACLYLMGWDDEHPLSLFKMNPQDGELIPARGRLDPQIGERAAGGLTVTNQLNPPCWDLIATTDGAMDAVETWQLSDYYRGGELEIPAESDTRLTVEFAPAEPRNYEGALTISSDDEDNPEIQIELTGTGQNNRGPRFVQIPEAIQAQAGRLIQFEVSGEDPDNNSLYFTLIRNNLPYAARLTELDEGRAQFTWRTTERDRGIYLPEIQLSDKVSFISATVPITVSDSLNRVPEESGIPLTLTLRPPYPNPFNQSTALSFNLPQRGRVRLEIYNATGRRAASIMNQELNAGEHHCEWQAEDLPAGIYLARLQSPQGVRQAKLVLIK